MTDLHYLSATEVLRAFRARELSPLEALDAVSARADAVEPTVNCLLERDHEGVREAAEVATERYARGEATGALDAMLSKIADFYEEEVDSAVAGMLTLLEPIMIAFLGVVVGGIVIAMYMPIFDMISKLT